MLLFWIFSHELEVLSRLSWKFCVKLHEWIFNSSSSVCYKLNGSSSQNSLQILTSHILCATSTSSMSSMCHASCCFCFCLHKLNFLPPTSLVQKNVLKSQNVFTLWNQNSEVIWKLRFLLTCFHISSFREFHVWEMKIEKIVHMESEHKRGRSEKKNGKTRWTRNNENLLMKIPLFVYFEFHCWSRNNTQRKKQASSKWQMSRKAAIQQQLEMINIKIWILWKFYNENFRRDFVLLLCFLSCAEYSLVFHIVCLHSLLSLGFVVCFPLCFFNYPR